jgi:PPP family 3-phenylpropionic acid transporter
MIGMLWAVGVVAEVLMFMAMSRILARFSVRRVLLASFLLAALRWVLLGNRSPSFVWVLLFAQVLHAATFGSFHAAAISFVQRSFGARQQGQGQALYAALAGTGGCGGRVVFRLQLECPRGRAWTFSIASLAAVAAAVIIATRMQEDRP